MAGQEQVQAWVDAVREALQPEIDALWNDPLYVRWRSDALFEHFLYGKPLPTEAETFAFLDEAFGKDVRGMLAKFTAERRPAGGSE